MYKYIFGPVFSRRFGSSLGIDLSPEKKSCNFDCLYCELEKSRTTDKIENEANPEEIIEEVKDFLLKNEYPDVITITANGEPTLYSKLEKLIDELNKIKGKSKLLILTNGSTIFNLKIQNILRKLDIVKVSLDAIDNKIFKKVDRPLNISVNQIIEGLKSFRKIYNGLLVIEILVVKNINDNQDFKKFAQILKEINPDRIDLGTVDRPPAYKVYPVSNKKLLEIAKYFKDLNINVVYRKEENLQKFDYSKEEIINTLKRRPFTISDIENLFSEKSKKNFNELLSKNIVKSKTIGNVNFFYVEDNVRA
ncbi:radical SAM protein [Hydrogenothermus marinus]|uniref:Wyosine [tRNA(Phe)-imidazoG37] synthetase (Radical SAM superfamily) n=1 Tax=Hydrogenothermus marinus TaxID=133270 RepID=A0A3M0B6R7_9AQUI|nr:radical SAM protein [Hydrogenothermus marinus]RMA93063.1 wyosine [tRNA(Phe)-imidazoG37] synthetase (radical SAM superfamily) [Hydrogenothermus marinus]